MVTFKYQSIIKTVFAAALIVLIIYIMQSLMPKTIFSPETTMQTPDAYVKDVYFVRTNKLGQLEQSISSKTIKHFKDHATLISPTIYLYKKDNKSPWKLTAKKGMSNRGVSNIVLNNDVVLTDTKKTTTLKTTSLNLLPKEKKITTNRPTTITQNDITIQSNGLKADLSTDTLILLSNTRGSNER